MSKISQLFTTSIGQKVIMSLTGLFLCSFLVIHMIGNLQLFKGDSGMAFNTYAVFMTTNPLIKITSYLLYASILYHAFKGLWLAARNRKARPVKYAMSQANANSHWTSRNMGILGTMILVFIVVHMSDFWAEYKFGNVPYTKYTENIFTGATAVEAMPIGHVQTKKIEEYMIGTDTRVVIVKDLYKEVSDGFQNIGLVLLYIVAMFAVSFHLYHGFQSAFQSLGINYDNYKGIIRAIGIWGFAILIPAGFAAMPLYFFLFKS